MHDHSQAVQHAAPAGFIRKHLFSLDHKVIGKQYYVPSTRGLEKRIAEKMEEVRKAKEAKREKS